MNNISLFSLQVTNASATKNGAEYVASSSKTETAFDQLMSLFAPQEKEGVYTASSFNYGRTAASPAALAMEFFQQLFNAIETLQQVADKKNPLLKEGSVTSALLGTTEEAAPSLLQDNDNIPNILSA